MNKKSLFGFIGAILGFPLSYYFQPGIVKLVGIGGYISHFGEVVNDANLFGNVILSVIIFALLGGLVGHFLDKFEEQKNEK